jgi:hypothetical protein
LKVMNSVKLIHPLLTTSSSGNQVLPFASSWSVQYLGEVSSYDSVDVSNGSMAVRIIPLC